MARAKARPGENPLVPDAVLRAMYTRVAEASLLEQHLAPQDTRRLRETIRGEEACRAAAMQCLAGGDLLSDASAAPAAELMAGAALSGVLLPARNKPAKGSGEGPLRLPREGVPRDQLEMALGAAQSLQTVGRQGLVVVLTEPRVDAATWRHVLGRAGSRDLPLIFLSLPHRGSSARTALSAGLLSDHARRWGVPGIPVDAVDGVALYRVLSEAALRARAGDGPSLIEAVAWTPGGTRTVAHPDPMVTMALALLARGACTTQWQTGVVQRFRRRLEQLKRPRATATR